MLTLILGLCVFLGAHSISIVARPLRNQLSSQSPTAWRIGFSLVSLLGFYLIVVGYSTARLEPIMIYQPPSWTRHLVMLLMLPVFPLIVASKMPCKLRSVTKHPMLVATKLWALSHLLANGTLADVILFGSFLAWAVIDRIALKRQGRAGAPAGSTGVVNDIIAVVVGLGLYGAFVVWGHTYLIGMPLIPTG